VGSIRNPDLQPLGIAAPGWSCRGTISLSMARAKARCRPEKKARRRPGARAHRPVGGGGRAPPHHGDFICNNRATWAGRLKGPRTPRPSSASACRNQDGLQNVHAGSSRIPYAPSFQTRTAGGFPQLVRPGTPNVAGSRVDPGREQRAARPSNQSTPDGRFRDQTMASSTDIRRPPQAEAATGLHGPIWTMISACSVSTVPRQQPYGGRRAC